MAKNDSRWDIGEVVSVTGAGSSPGDGDDKWDQGLNVTFYEVSAGTAYQKTLSDTVGITDVLTPAVGYTKSLADNVGISDSIAKSVGYAKTLSDNVGITDVLSKSVGYVKTISDTVGITDLLSRVVNYVRTISDTVGITDVLSRVVNYIRTIADTVGITDILSIPDLGEFVDILSVEFEDYIINDIDVSDNIEQAISADDYIILNIQSEGTT